MQESSKLGLGGHTFIEELGNDPKTSFEEQCAIVSACLDRGITLIDTTYYQERVALGSVLKQLGRRDEAKIMAWNFFRKPGDDNVLQPYSRYEPHRIDEMLEELQTDVIDLLVIHADSNQIRLNSELELAGRWIKEGKVRQAALGMAKEEHLHNLPEHHPLSYVLAPYNAFNRSSEAVFRLARDQGMRSIALSPFVRGYKLDEIGEDPRIVSSKLLRWAAINDLVEAVIVAMRKVEYPASNLDILREGPLTDEERRQVDEWAARTTKN